jgi:3-oxoadipate enol-lactonase
MDIDGFTFNVLHEGDPSKPLVVLCHALMSNLHMWDSTVKALHAAGYSTLRYDHIGHGQTSVPSADRVGRLHIDDFCRYINEMVERTIPGKRPYGLIGCSIGGVIALRYALMYPEQLSYIISCDAPGMTSLEEAKIKWKDRMKMFREQGVEPLAKATVERWFPDPCPPDVKVESLQHTMSVSFLGYAAMAEAIMNYDYTSELGNIKTEKTAVMILAGENDEAIGPQEILIDVHQRIPGSQHVLMKDTGHIPPMHQAAEFERIVISFLKG